MPDFEMQAHIAQTILQAYQYLVIRATVEHVRISQRFAVLPTF